jgi:hypothetical protein
MRSESTSSIDWALIIRMRMFLVLFMAMMIIVAVQIVRSGSGGLLATPIGLLIGYLIGLLTSRMLALSWDDEAHKVVGRMDVLGAVVLILYIVFTWNRTWILSEFAQGDLLTAVSYSVLAGLFLGQLFGTAKGIRRVIAALGRAANNAVPEREVDPPHS